MTLSKGQSEELLKVFQSAAENIGKQRLALPTLLERADQAGQVFPELLRTATMGDVVDAFAAFRIRGLIR